MDKQTVNLKVNCGCGKSVVTGQLAPNSSTIHMNAADVLAWAVQHSAVERHTVEFGGEVRLQRGRAVTA